MGEDLFSWPPPNFGPKTGLNLSKDLFSFFFFFFGLHLILGRKTDLILGWKIFILVFIILKFSEFPGLPPPPLSKILRTILVIFIKELTKIGDSDALTIFSKIKEKRALPEVENFFLEIRAITRQTTLTRKWRSLFSRRRTTKLWPNCGGPQSNGPCRFSRNTKRATVPKRLRTTGLGYFQVIIIAS